MSDELKRLQAQLELCQKERDSFKAACQKELRQDMLKAVAGADLHEARVRIDELTAKLKQTEADLWSKANHLHDAHMENTALEHKIESLEEELAIAQDKARGIRVKDYSLASVIERLDKQVEAMRKAGNALADALQAWDDEAPRYELLDEWKKSKEVPRG